MLKLMYSESGFRCEQIEARCEDWLIQRSIFAMRVGEPFQIEPGRASFLVQVEHSIFDTLVTQILTETQVNIEICTVDEEYVEISLEGNWIGTNDHEGLFITTLKTRTEQLISQVWATVQTARI